jgi:hypothetical protein
MSRIGLRPKRSLRLPSTGENRNCIMAKANMSQPPYTDASLMLPPISSLISLGNTGMMIPKPVTSMRRVTKMNPKAAFLGCDMSSKNRYVIDSSRQ